MIVSISPEHLEQSDSQKKWVISETWVSELLTLRKKTHFDAHWIWQNERQLFLFFKQGKPGVLSGYLQFNSLKV